MQAMSNENEVKHQAIAKDYILQREQDKMEISNLNRAVKKCQKTLGVKTDLISAVKEVNKRAKHAEQIYQEITFALYPEGASPNSKNVVADVHALKQRDDSQHMVYRFASDIYECTDE